MDYPKRTDLILPEYGRNIQQMVEYAVSIPDKADCARCAQTIINIMGNMFPYLRDVNDFKHKLWDHLAVMSNYKLDIDYPCDVLTNDKIRQKPRKVAYQSSKIRYMHYGRLVQDMIRIAMEMEEGPKRDAFVLNIANQMKKQFLTWNKETVDDKKIQLDLQELSGGKLAFNADTLIDSKDLFQRRKTKQNNNSQQRRKKK